MKPVQLQPDTHSSAAEQGSVIRLGVSLGLCWENPDVTRFMLGEQTQRCVYYSNDLRFGNENLQSCAIPSAVEVSWKSCSQHTGPAGR